MTKTMLEGTAQSAAVEEPSDTAEPVQALFTDGTRSAALLEWADCQGMAPALALLASALARASEDGQADFVAAVRRPAPEDHAAPRWLMWLWAEAPVSIRDRLSDLDDVAAVERVIDMYRRTVAGDTIGSAEWRAARRAFAGALSKSAPPAVVETVSAAMWDIATTPGAIADAAVSWINQTAMADAFAPSGWTIEEHLRVTTTWDAYGIEHARQNRKRSGEADDAFKARMNTYMRDHPNPLSRDDMTRWNIWQEHQRRLTALRTAELRDGLRTIIAA